jgi:hypothetical protein
MDRSSLEKNKDIHCFTGLDKRAFRDAGFERDLSAPHVNLILEALINYGGNGTGE